MILSQTEADQSGGDGDDIYEDDPILQEAGS